MTPFELCVFVFVRWQALRHAEELVRLNDGLAKFLKEGILSDDYVLDNPGKLMNTMRKCNVTLRWLMLHTAPLSPGAHVLPLPLIRIIRRFVPPPHIIVQEVRSGGLLICNTSSACDVAIARHRSVGDVVCF